MDSRVGDAAGREKDFHAAPESVTDPYAVETDKPPNAHRSRPDPASRFRKAFRNAEALASARTLAQGAARSSDLDFTRGASRKLLEVARSPASALPARPSVFHRCASSRRCRDCGRTRSRRPGGRRTPGGAHTLVGRRDHPGRRRPRSRRSCSSSHLGRWAQASFLNTRPGKPLLAPDVKARTARGCVESPLLCRASLVA